MNRYLKGFAACLFMLALIYLYFCIQSFSHTVSIKQAPDWIDGTFLMTTRGSTEHTEKEPIDKYVCAFDFDSDTISAVEIPSNAELIKDMYTSKPLFFFNTEGSHQTIGDANGYTANRWWRYRRGDINYTSVGRNHILDSTLSEFVYKTGERPVTILSSGGAWKDFYLLRQGTSESGVLEVQLCLVRNYSKDNESLNILHCFPSNYSFQNWNYTISKDCKIAWIDYIVEDFDHYGIGISDGNSKEFLYDTDPDENIYGGIAWLNDNTLLYVSDTSECTEEEGMLFEFTLMQWHIDTSATEPLKSPQGIDFVTEDRPQAIAVNDDATCIALYCPVWSGMDYIMFISPQTGETYKYYPWTEEDNNVNNTTHYWYGQSDNGIVFYEPLDMLEPEIVWYSPE